MAELAVMGLLQQSWEHLEQGKIRFRTWVFPLLWCRIFPDKRTQDEEYLVFHEKGREGWGPILPGNIDPAFNTVAV